jgi:membrane-associated phospholipid phosphatase
MARPVARNITPERASCVLAFAPPSPVVFGSNVRGRPRSAVLKAAVPPSRRTLLVAVGLVCASLALFLLIAEELLDGSTLISHDQAALSWFVDHRTDAWVRAAKLVSTVGGFASLLVTGVVLGLWLWRRGWQVAIAPVVSLLLAGLASVVAKAAFGRVRPPIVFHEAHVTSPAFPSGHATDAAAFFLAAAFVVSLAVARHRRTQLLFIVVGMLCAGFVGLSRLVLAVHWLSDVVAGWALGTAIAITLVVALWFSQTRHPGPNQRPPASRSIDR